MSPSDQSRLAVALKASPPIAPFVESPWPAVPPNNEPDCEAPWKARRKGKDVERVLAILDELRDERRAG